MGCHTTYNNDNIFGHLTQDSEAKSRTKLLFLSVKPNVFKDKMELNLDDTVGDIILVSVMAGITIDRLRDRFRLAYRPQVSCVRLMPNTATAVCKGVCGLAIDPNCANREQVRDFLTRVLSLIGLCEFVAEDQINAVCGLGGSGIAFVSQTAI